MRRLSRGIFGVTTGLALLGGGVMAFGQGQLSPQTAATGDGGFTLVPPAATGNVLYDNATPTSVLTGLLTNTSAGPGQTEVVSGAVQNIADPAGGACQAWIDGDSQRVTGAVAWTGHTPTTDSGPVVQNDHADFEVDLTMVPNNALDLSTLTASNTTIGSDCAGQTLSYDLVLQSSMYGPG
ncbi:MAG: hypothetical protein QOE72_1387 [Chloroflexota bacterium]|jgi:hypothetical protein|nr:hypothetical protein [Chloroflexota bacterium]